MDYALKMNNFFDQAQKQVATIKKIEETYTVAEMPVTTSSYAEIEMPTNYYQMVKVEHDFKEIQWIRRGRKKIAVKSDETFPVDVFYFKYPTDITPITPDTYEFEVDIEAQECLPYFVAAQIILDQAMSGQLMDIYQNMLANLDSSMSTGQTSVVNALFTRYETKLF